jgi:chemotaxis protein MotA
MVRFICLAVLAAAGFLAGGEAWREFFDASSLLITVGGTLAVTFLTFSWSRLSDAAALVWSLWTEKPQSREKLVEELRRLTRLYRLKGSRGLEGQEDNIADPFLRRGAGMLIDIEGEENIREQLESAIAAFAARYEAAQQIFLTMAKLLPAFGLIGTLIGLVLLLRQMSGSDPAALTSSFALALMTTLYGALLANVVALPLAAKLYSVEQERKAVMRALLEWTVSLARGTAPTAVERKLNAFFVPAGDRQRGEKSWSRRVLSWQR